MVISPLQDQIYNKKNAIRKMILHTITINSLATKMRLHFLNDTEITPKISPPSEVSFYLSVVQRFQNNLPFQFAYITSANNLVVGKVMVIVYFCLELFLLCILFKKFTYNMRRSTYSCALFIVRELGNRQKEKCPIQQYIKQIG